MTDHKLVKTAREMLEEHNGVYLEKQLYIKLKKKFPGLARADFNEVLRELLEKDFVMDRELIRPRVKMTKRTSYEE